MVAKVTRCSASTPSAIAAGIGDGDNEGEHHGIAHENTAHENKDIICCVDRVRRSGRKRRDRFGPVGVARWGLERRRQGDDAVGRGRIGALPSQIQPRVEIFLFRERVVLSSCSKKN